MEKKGKEKKVIICHATPHRAMFKTWRISNKPPAMSTGLHTEQIHLPKLDFRTGVKYPDSMGAQKNNENTVAS